MKQKSPTRSLEELKAHANTLPDLRRNEQAMGAYGMKQPGYYLIRLRLRHSQKPIRPLARVS